jgi:isopentenyl phosphate kinase
MPETQIPRLQLLKLGGSIITDKSRPRSPRPDVIRRLAEEISAAREADPPLHLIIGNGAGSFGHVPAKKFATRQGVHSPADWRGFLEVWGEAKDLNEIVMDHLQAVGLPVIAFPPVSCVTADDGVLIEWNLTPVIQALGAGLIPVVHGDVAFDLRRGGTILSTEDLFTYLAIQLHPRRVLLAGLEPGVWVNYPQRLEIIPEINPDNISTALPALSGSAGTDVTGGMASKVRQSLDLAHQIPGLEVLIFSGEGPGNVRRALDGERLGTVILGRSATNWREGV